MDSKDHVRISSTNNNNNNSTTWNYSNTLGFLFAIVALVIFLICFSIYKKSKVKKNGILLFGLCESGKTLIFARLVFNKFIQTHTSIKENLNFYSTGKADFNIIDIPGHERLRNRYFEQFKTQVRALVFVIDSSTVQREIKDVAEYLYSCLIDSYIASCMPPLLILCNKQGEATAKGSTVIKMMLEKELNIVRTTKSNQLESIGKNMNNNYLGKEGVDFEFSHLAPMKVDFAECSALINDDEKEYNIKELEQWIQKLT
ncbi:Signal recognition particle receptor subunit beta, putative [Pediculus humanus corporis]|uniref:Signal recognition particle receptor subunit beta n=1 Tax=Pediculus humanus subsp. corporis TaxID=121224 RepID=E0VFZ7_PEDHC|nr:Signal recognition particle receptor subunit beta, putative [Pediculus humanus corporis]EEB12303.1 Signal recognition particle receptor subunit beta, putative [Pediculus humanus corporis]